MMNKDLEEKVYNFLINIEKEIITIIPLTNPSEVFAGNVSYIASNGWKITIFNDANSWDYVDEIIMLNDKVIDFDTFDKMDLIRNYIPPLDVIRSIYLIDESSNDR